MKTITAARWISLLAAFIWGAVAEYHLATAVGADRYTAVLLPVVLDVYGFAAMRAARTLHVGGALVTMFATQMVSHLLTLGHAPGRIVALAIGVSAIPPAVSLACHRLGAHAATVDAPAETVDANDVTLERLARSVVLENRGRIAAPVVDAPAETVTPVGSGASLTKAEFAEQGAKLIADGHTKTSAAEALGISRQWLHACMREHATA